MRTSIILSSALALAGNINAVPVANASSDASIEPFVLHGFRQADHTGSHIHYAPINARGGKFWIRKDTASSCPLKNKKKCPRGTDTVQFLGPVNDYGFHTLLMDVEVPGGQQAYVASDGALSYSHPHASVPRGSSTESFALTGPFLVNTFGKEPEGWRACPVGNPKDKIFQVYAPVKDFKKKDCIRMDILASYYRSQAPAAWQYD